MSSAQSWSYRLLLATAVLLGKGEVAAAELSGLVSKIHDGDSLTLTTSAGDYRIRLINIDAPEMQQPFGVDSRLSLYAMCSYRMAFVKVVAQDVYGRHIADVRCDGTDASVEQVRRGMAWVYERYATKKSPLYAIQAEAQNARRGLWAATVPIPPWDWRRAIQHREPRLTQD